MELPDKATCYKALQSRDTRFDGLIFVGVKSTGIYCRPVCPARTAKFENCTFYGSAAAAQEAGYRPCLRCRPETAPQFASWRGTSNTVSRALALIGEGALDGEKSSVERLADRLGVGERQLRRLFLQHLGASPIAVAQTRRVLFAKQLIHDTALPMTEVALAAGFSSLRRFNEVFHDLFHRPPSSLRRRSAANLPDDGGGTIFRIRYRAPYDWQSMLEFLRARAIPGVETVEKDVYKRTVEIGGWCGFIEVKHLPRKDSLCVTIHFPVVQAMQEIVNRVRRLFDLGADIETIDEHLSLDRDLGAWVARRPGLRAPGGWDGFELAVRAVLGQQVSVQAARQLAGKLVALHGRVIKGVTLPEGLTHAFPTAARIAGAEDLGVGMPRPRLDTLKAIAQASVDDPRLFQPSADVDEAIARLTAVRGIGDWTAQYVAMRVIREVDAFPASDIGLLRGAEKVLGEAVTAKSLALRAESWRPWRAYAAQHLWAADGARAAERTETAFSEERFRKSSKENLRGNRHELVL
jgi:AraC family transcriptional regulator, regulatory protein of adaptative response / DNA-3-methyladenine glycosylase II